MGRMMEAIMATLWGAFMAGPFDDFIECLDLASTKNLRLTCRAVNDRCLTPHFKKNFEEIVTTLDPNRLNSLLTFLKNPVLGLQTIRRLTIMATVYDFAPLHLAIATHHRNTVANHGRTLYMSHNQLTPEDMTDVKSELTWMHVKSRPGEKQDAQPIINQLASILRILSSLEKLTLDLVCVKGPAELIPGGRSAEWAPVWASAIETYHQASEAMARSQAAIDHFDFFAKPALCTLEPAEMTERIIRDDLFKSNFAASVASQFKKLSLSFSPKKSVDIVEVQIRERGSDRGNNEEPVSPLGHSRWQYKGNESDISHPDYHRHIAEILTQMAQLEELDLHQEQVPLHNTDQDDQIFKQISQVTLPKLRRVIFHGMRTDEKDLLRFFRGHSNLTHVDLHNFQLTSGTWESIFNCFAHEMPFLMKLRLAELKSSAIRYIDLTPANYSGIASVDIRTAADLEFLKKVAFQALTEYWEFNTWVMDKTELREGLDLSFQSETINQPSGATNFWTTHYDERDLDSALTRIGLTTFGRHARSQA